MTRTARTAEPVAAPVPAVPRIGHLNRWLGDWLPALPLLLVAYGLLVLPILVLIVQSFISNQGVLTLDNWAEVLSSGRDRRAIGTSLLMGASSATIALAIGGPLAWWLSRMRAARSSIWLAMFNTATNFGNIGLAFGFVAILGTYGMITLLLQQLGFPFSPPSPGSFIGLVMAYSYGNVPMFILLTLPGMSILKPQWAEAAETCGATHWQFWRMVGLPILLPFLAAGWLLIFTWSVGLYGIPFALTGGGRSTEVSLITLQIAKVLESSFSGQAKAATLSVLLLLIAVISLLVYRWTLRRAARWF